MTLDLDARAGILGQPVGVGFEDLAVLRANRIVIVVEMDVAERSLAAGAQRPLLELVERATTAITTAAAASVTNRPEPNRPG
jgi:hypothetical protein